jgi:hypothetical protein
MRGFYKLLFIVFFIFPLKSFAHEVESNLGYCYLPESQVDQRADGTATLSFCLNHQSRLSTYLFYDGSYYILLNGGIGTHIIQHVLQAMN